MFWVIIRYSLISGGASIKSRIRQAGRQAGMSPRAVMRIAPTGRPIMDRNVRRVSPRPLLKTAA